MAALFLFTAIATTLAVIYNVVTTNNTNKAGSSTTNSKDLTHLAGTKLSGFTPVSDVPKLKITDSTVGSGAVATATSTVSVLYTGAVAATGTIFQASSDSSPEPVTLQLNQVIKGWQLGIPGMRVGGTRQLLIPASEAYGANPPSGSNIPANAPLVFNVTLLAVKS
jgi:FKBP-type peptidyl-prolyl cis-trans isomerase